MSIEQIARDLVVEYDQCRKGNINGYHGCHGKRWCAAAGHPNDGSHKNVSGLTMAFPDIKFDVQKVTVKGNEATVDAMWSGTNSGTFNLPIPGMAPIPPTGKKVSVRDSYVVTVQDDKVSHIQVKSPADGGIPAALAQMGVKCRPCNPFLIHRSHITSIIHPQRQGNLAFLLPAIAAQSQDQHLMMTSNDLCGELSCNSPVGYERIIKRSLHYSKRVIILIYSI